MAWTVSLLDVQMYGLIRRRVCSDDTHREIAVMIQPSFTSRTLSACTSSSPQLGEAQSVTQNTQPTTQYTYSQQHIVLLDVNISLSAAVGRILPSLALTSANIHSCGIPSACVNVNNTHPFSAASVSISDTKHTAYYTVHVQSGVGCDDLTRFQ
ncbi:hypothetical protein J6590_077999 [Homalodisca vitripennis]|nr:hypothetical protein J6590_077999 [Homalodisca vitripennis]